MTAEHALAMMGDVLEGLRRSEMVAAGGPLGPGKVLIGPGAVLDSLGFVSFIAEMEDRLNRDRSEPVELILTEIWDFSSENPTLTAAILADYCAKTLG